MTIKYLIHANKFGWCIRLSGWTGPKIAQFDTQEEAVLVARNGARGIDWAIEPAEEREIMIVEDQS